MHKRCSGVIGCLCKASLSYARSFCPTDIEVKSCDVIGDGSSVDIVDEYCCLGDGDADGAVTARIHSGWFTFRSRASFLTAKDVSLLL